MKLSTTIACVLLVLCGSAAYSAAPKLINYQGRLTTPGGTSVTDGVYTIRFRIYADSTTATPLWEEIQPVSVASGLFAVMLGGSTALPDTAFVSANRFLGTKVDLDAELTPRSRLVSVPYALSAADWAVSGKRAYNHDSIGIGTSQPARRFELNDSTGSHWIARFGGNSSLATMLELTNTTSTRTWEIGTAGNVGDPFRIPRSFFIHCPPLGYIPLVIDTTGHVGIDASPQIGVALLARAVSLPAPHATVDGIYGAGAYGGNGVVGYGGPAGLSAGIYGVANNSSARAGFFNGNVDVNGTLSKSAGSFKIDHPLDPANKYLEHSFVESPDMKNLYDGVVTLDGSGQATVTMPNWFEALNQDYRYQLTAIGAPGPNLYVAQKMAGNHFGIAGGSPGMEVSWQVTGIRHDAYANAHRIPVEEDKPLVEQEHYIHPDLFGQPEELSVEWARHPELMKRTKAEREKAAVPENH